MHVVQKDLTETPENISLDPIKLTSKQLAILQALAQGRHSKMHHKQRATIILLYFENNKNITQIARQLQCTRNTIRKWRDRWHKNYSELIRIEKEHPHELKSSIESALDDAYRCGAPGKFTPEQIDKIVTMVLESKPEDHGIPATQWTIKDIAKEKTLSVLCLDLLWKPLKEKVRFGLLLDGDNKYILMSSSFE